MAIKKMTFIHIHGKESELDRVLALCLADGCFQPEYASRLSEFSIGTAAMPRNPYGALFIKAGETAACLGLELADSGEPPEWPDDPERFLRQADARLDELAAQEPGAAGTELSALYGQIAYLKDTWELRRYAVVIRGTFHVVGFVPTGEKERFLEAFEHLSVTVEQEPAGQDPRVEPPVVLKNNRFVRPFEMFVSMYGLPAYGDIDPTPFVAYTYSFLFGMMFGDLGHGFCVALAGVYMWKKMGMALGRIMTRIGAVSMVFGALYGSVFGFEHLLDPMFHALGFAEKPIEVMHPDTTTKILIAAIAIGAGLILTSIAFNLVVGIKKRNWPRVLLSNNGICGFIFYAAVLFAAVMTIGGHSVLTAPYVLLTMVLPLLIIFFHEPIHRLAHLWSTDAEVHQDEDLVKNTILEHQGADITRLFRSEFMRARFGRIPTESYRKLVFYQNEPFMLYPVKTDDEYIWMVYAMAAADEDEIDAIFEDLFFERIFIPESELASAETAGAFILKCIQVGGTPSEAQAVQKENAARITPHRSVYQRIFPEGFGGFFMETFFEMFEVLLSFISNTVSFLRVGGFVLVHAGMMSVVMTLAEMVGAGANIPVIIFGNLLVMVLEGLIVGIQVLRLEFYEMFSRFYDAGGTPFRPVKPEFPAVSSSN